MWTTAKQLILPALLGVALIALPATSHNAFAWGSGGGHGGGGHGGGGHGGGGHGGGGHGGGGGGGHGGGGGGGSAGGGGDGGGGRVGSLIHDCSEGSYQFWCRNKQFKVRKGGGHYRTSRQRVRVHYKQAAVASRYKYVPSQRVVVYEPQVVYAPKVVYTPQVVYEKKVIRKARVVKRHDYHVRPSYRAAPARAHYEGPVMTTEEAVHTDYDGHGILVYRPVSRKARHRRKYGHRAHQRARHGHYTHAKRKYSRKRHHRRRKAHARYRHRKAHAHSHYKHTPAYTQEPAYEHSARQPVKVYVVKRRRIHKKIPLFGSKKSYRRKTVRVRHRKHSRRRVCSPCGHVSYKKKTQ